ncbi:Alpha/Beta hydrolase protein [Ilyonectria robusta]|uniref:Alpha/Beta hydrolase protein n=1 Tax=Ilyonectria robusta TaxID=1079257 RepID=UPI001E8E43BD|nr:Alpha/Beta hydrolase protein [Ilyonectria robusta]KAH8658585.1 Alpha/Beta hydrolase protein [Ilyonectria robusta]
MAEPPPNEVVVGLPTWTTPSYTQTVIGKKSYLSDDLDEFRGIPFGQVTKRWEHAKLRTRLPYDVFDATKNGPICPQPSAARNSEYFQAHLTFPDLEASEFNCLNLLIVRPSAAGLSRAGIDESSKLPVLVYIHGGARTGGGSDPILDPSRLVLRSLEIGFPIIAVNLNYRAGVFGFLGSADVLKTQDRTEVMGLNFGLYDQKVGLTWVAHNIMQFGGDPEQITLGGGSAGGSCVYAHLLDADAHAEKPLFQRALVQSGAMLTLLPMPLAEAEANWDKLCQHWGIEAESSSQYKVESLRHVSTAAMLQSALENHVFMLPPIADGLTLTKETAALPCVDLRREIKSMGYRPVEVMIGATDVEVTGHAQCHVDVQKLRQGFAESYPTPEAGAQVLEAYGLVQGFEQSALRAGLERLHSDIIFDLGIYRARALLCAQRRAEYGDATSIQPYHIEFGNPFPGLKRGCAHHGIEAIYMFDAFHDALADADNGVFKAYPESYAKRTAGSEAESALEETIADSETLAVNHLELVKGFQDHLIGFIVGNPAQRVAQDEIFIWGKDGSSRVEHLVETPRWAERIDRLKLLEKDTSSVMKALRIL